MKKHLSRRRLLRAAASTGISFPFVNNRRASAAGIGRELRIGGIGVGGKGWSDIQETTAENARVVALCDIDAGRLARAAREYPEAKTFTDWRKNEEDRGPDACQHPDRGYPSILEVATVC